MKLLTNEQESRLRQNHALQDPERAIDFKPVVKLFGGSATWLLAELDDDNILFGLCDLGFGFPELGYVSLNELESYQGFPLIERDRHFVATKTLSEYATEAWEHQMIRT